MPGSESANLHSIDALRDIRAALVLFQERAISAMGDLRQKIDRTVAWIEQDRPNYWREQEHRTYDLMASTRIAYETCRLRTTGGRRSDCIEEKKAFERAKRRMEVVREKQALVKKWMVQAAREANEYRARTSGFQRALENDVSNMIAQLGRMLDAIEAYAEVKSSGNTTTQSLPSNSLNSSTDVASAVNSQPASSKPTEDTPRMDSHE